MNLSNLSNYPRGDGQIHLTVAAVCERDGRFLLVREVVDGRPVLNQPAGHVEPGERILNAVVRETLEETGWETRPVALVGFSTYHAAAPGITFYRVTIVVEPIRQACAHPPDADIQEALWLEFDAIAGRADLRSPMVQADLQRYLEGKLFPLEVLREFE